MAVASSVKTNKISIEPSFSMKFHMETVYKIESQEAIKVDPNWNKLFYVCIIFQYILYCHVKKNF